MNSDLGESKTVGLLAQYQGYRQQGCWLNIRDIDIRAVG
jgi:hypothetical protein